MDFLAAVLLVPLDLVPVLGLFVLAPLLLLFDELIGEVVHLQDVVVDAPKNTLFLKSLVILSMSVAISTISISLLIRFKKIISMFTL